MAGTIDANLFLRQSSDGALSATAIYSADIGGTPMRGMAFAVYVPVVDTATDQTLDAIIRASTASDPATTDVEIGRLSDLEQASGWYHIPFSTNKRSVELELVVAGTSPNFSTVLVAIVEPQFAWSRGVEFR